MSSSGLQQANDDDDDEDNKYNLSLNSLYNISVQITPQSELVVTNALYFKGTWLHKFEPRPAECFYKDSVCRKVAMMELDAELNYAYVDNLRAHALELPYQVKMKPL